MVRSDDIHNNLFTIHMSLLAVICVRASDPQEPRVTHPDSHVSLTWHDDPYRDLRSLFWRLGASPGVWLLGGRANLVGLLKLAFMVGYL